MPEDQQTEAPSQEELYPDPQFKEMVDAGLFFGRKRSRTNPRMKPFILTNRNEIEIINLAKTEEGLERARGFLAETIKQGGRVLVVATQPAAAGAQQLAVEFGLPVVATRWLGGTLTNFRIISGRIEYFKKLKADWAKNAFEKYTKKEKLEIEREIAKLSETLSGLESMSGLPQALLVIDSNLHATAVREARKLKIPIVGFVNTDSDPDLITHPVAGNTKARLSINWFLGKIREAIAPAIAAYKAGAAAAEQAKSEKKE